MSTTKRDLHQEITDRIIAAVEAGARPWRQNWTSAGGGGLPLRSCGTPYRGVNVLILWLTAGERGFRARNWFTFKQAQALGACVRKGEKGTTVVYYSTFEKEVEGQEDPARIGFLKSYSVFNAEQVDGLPEKFFPAAEPAPVSGPEAIAELDAFFSATGATIHNDGSDPCYRPASDAIHMPKIAAFATAGTYYGTLAHELMHWTGAAPRLDRLKSYDTTAGRALEELVAEIGACFLGTELGAPHDFDNSVAYVASWLKALRDDKRMIFRAASAAQKASDYALATAGRLWSEETAPAPAAAMAMRPAPAPAAMRAAPAPAAMRDLFAA